MLIFHCNFDEDILIFCNFGGVSLGRLSDDPPFDWASTSLTWWNDFLAFSQEFDSEKVNFGWAFVLLFLCLHLNNSGSDLTEVAWIFKAVSDQRIV